MASTTSKAESSFGQTLHFITSIKLQEVDKQRHAYREHAKVIDEARAAGNIVERVELLSKAVKKWSGSGAIKPHSKDVGGELNLDVLDFWLQQAKKDPSFSLEIAERWAQVLEEHIRHTSMRFDAAKLFGSLFNEWLASGDSSAVSYHNGPDDSDLGSDAGLTDASSFVEVGRKEMHDQKEKLVSIVFDEHPVDVEKLKAYLEELFEPEESQKILEKLRHELKIFGHHLHQKKLTRLDVTYTIKGLLASGLMDEEKRNTLKAFEENPTVLDEVASVLNMRLASFDSWQWPQEGILVEMRRHLNGKYRAFTDPEIIDALMLHYLGVAWQVKLKQSLKLLFQSKAWARSPPPTHKDKERWTEQLGSNDGSSAIEVNLNQIRKSHFFLSQLHDEAARPSAYDDLVDAPADKQAGSPAAIKQELLHLITTDCYLNKALRGSHAIIRSDMEWFGPSLPHASILTVLEFLGVSKRWVSFYEAFLAASIRFPGEKDARVRKRGTPISYSLSVVCGEVVLFIMDYAVNQRTNGLHLYRMHDDLWLWDSSAQKCADGWDEMNKYAKLVGLKFNQKKTGSAYVGSPAGEVSGLPAGDIRWGFLKFDPAKSRFAIDQEDVNLHIAELRRQLASTKSVFGWVNAYNKYLAFMLRNFGGVPANCFDRDHLMDMIDTLARIQREIFSGENSQGGAVGYLRKTIEERFGITDLPEGYFYFPISAGGLELKNMAVDLLMLERRNKPLSTYKFTSKATGAQADENEDDDEDDDESEDDDDASSSCSRDSWGPHGVSDPTVFDATKTAAEDMFIRRVEFDRREYDRLKEAWDLDSDNRRQKKLHFTSTPDEFMSFEEYISLRESWLDDWGTTYEYMLELPGSKAVPLVADVRAAMENGQKPRVWGAMSLYDRWIMSMYGQDVVKRFGGLDVVDPNLIPIGMVELFKTSRMKLDQ